MVLAAGLLALGFHLFRDRLLSGKEVEVGRVLAVQLAAAPATGEPSAGPKPAAAGEVVFQASGWVEPSPAAVHVDSQVNGQVETVPVKDGQDVEQNQVLATMVDEDFRYAREIARAKFCQAQAEEDAARVQAVAARNLVEARQAAVASVLASLEETKDLAARFEGLADGAVPAVEKVGARLALARAEAAVAEQRALLTEAESEAARRHKLIWVAETVRRAAAFQLAEAELAASRTIIRSPVAGRIQRLTAAPGQRKRVDGDDPDSAAIALIYQPSNLQIRVDVPLADAAGLQVGQSARVRTSLLPGNVLDGKVDFIGGEADRQRNTLAAILSLAQPAERLRPGVLCRVEFLAGAAGASGTRTDSPSRDGGMGLVLYVPLSALAGSESKQVWVVDPESRRVTTRAVVLGPGASDGHREVREGLRPGEWVVLNPGPTLKDGERVNPGNPQP